MAKAAASSYGRTMDRTPAPVTDGSRDAGRGGGTVELGTLAVARWSSRLVCEMTSILAVRDELPPTETRDREAPTAAAVAPGAGPRDEPCGSGPAPTASRGAARGAGVEGCSAACGTGAGAGRIGAGLGASDSGRNGLSAARTARASSETGTGAALVAVVVILDAGMGRGAAVGAGVASGCDAAAEVGEMAMPMELARRAARSDRDVAVGELAPKTDWNGSRAISRASTSAAAASTLARLLGGGGTGAAGAAGRRSYGPAAETDARVDWRIRDAGGGWSDEGAALEAAEPPTGSESKGRS